MRWRDLRTWNPLVVLAGAQALLVLDASTAGITLGPIAASLGADAGAVRGVFTLSALLVGVTLLTAGKLGDVLGRRRALLLGLGFRVVGSTMAAAAPTVLVFAVGEAVLEGVGAALVITSTAALIASTYRGTRRVRAYSVVGGACAAVTALGPVLGGLVVQWWSWRAVYGAEAALAVLLLAAAPRALRHERPSVRARPRLDWAGAALSSLGLVLVVLGLQQMERLGWWRPRVGAPSWFGFSPAPLLVGAGAAVLVAFVRGERRAQRDGRPTLFDLALLSVRGMVPTLLVGGVAQMAAIGLYFSYPLLLLVVLELPPAVVGLVVAPSAVTSFAAALAWPRLARRWSPAAVARLSGCCLVAAGLALWVRVGPGGWEVPTAVSAACLGLAVGLLGAQLPAAAQGLVDDEHRSETAGLLGTAQNLGAAFGFAAVGSVVLLSMSYGVEQLLRTEAAVGAATTRVAELEIDRGLPFVSVDRLRAEAVEREVAADDVEGVVRAYERAQRHGLESGALLVAGLGVVIVLLARWMPGGRRSP